VSSSPIRYDESFHDFFRLVESLLVKELVTISPPSAIKAKRVHDLTALPLRITVQAPQLLVSHPT
jgi:hypothetical protein